MSASRREPPWRRYLRLLRPNVDEDVTDELRFHLEMREREFQTKGMTSDAASRAARERFGDVEHVASWLRAHDRQRQRDFDRRETLSMFFGHLRHAVRSLRRHRSFTAAAVLTLTLGLGATTAIFAVVNGVLLEPLAYPDANQLVGLWHTTPVAAGMSIGQSDASYFTYRRLAHTFSDVGVYTETAVNLVRDAVPERVSAVRASAGVLQLLRVQPVVGRAFTADEDRPGHAPVALINEGLWHGAFGGAPNVVGSQLRIDGVPTEVIGIIPDQIHFPRDGIQVWLPLALDPANVVPSGFNYTGIGRLRPGVTRQAAAADLQRVLDRFADIYPMAAPGITMHDWLGMAKPRVVVRPLRDDVVGDVGRVLWVILGTIGFVLLAACANVANLCLLRAEDRQRELAVCRALGAGRRDVLTRFLAEGLLVTTAGVVLGTALAAAVIRLLRTTTAVPLPRLSEIRIDGTVLGVTALIALGVALLVSALPMLRTGGRDLSGALRTGGRGATGGRDRRRAQRTLVVTQVALAFVLLAASALMARTFAELRGARLGFDAAHALTLNIALPEAIYPHAADVVRFYGLLGDRFAQLPGVDALGVTSALPLDAEAKGTNSVWVDGEELAPGQPPATRSISFVSPTYFRSLAIPLVSGHAFRQLAAERGSDEAIISVAFAAQAFGDPTGFRALGRRVSLLPTGPWLTVVGVVGDIRDKSLDQPPGTMLYLPLNSVSWGIAERYAARAVTVVVRASGDPGSLAAPMRRAMTALDPGLPVFDVRPMRDAVARSMARTTFTAFLLAIAAAVALALGAVGLYGVVAYTVAMRTREIGLRIALGARPGAVARLFAAQGAGLAATGIGVGLLGALVVARVLRSLLYGVTATDPLMLGGAALLLLAVGLGASWLPARRASRVDPASVLSAD